jgi:hypothetical protein
MKIKDGYNGKELEIRISASNRHAAIWLIQNGLPDTPEMLKYRETLSYATLDELLDLKKEIENTMKDILEI